jgi:hypothetical protein
MLHSQPQERLLRATSRLRRNLGHRQIGSQSEMGENYALARLYRRHGSLSLQVSLLLRRLCSVQSGKAFRREVFLFFYFRKN